MGLGEEGGEEGDVPWTLLPLWVERGFDGGGGEGDSTVFLPVGIVVVRTRAAFRAPRVTEPRTGGPRLRKRTTWNGGGRKGGRGRLGKGEGNSRGGASVVRVAAIVGNEGVEGAANHLGGGGRSYGGPQREGRVIM
jgi:hypothetical protein